MIGPSPVQIPTGAVRWEPRRRVVGMCLALAAITLSVFGRTLTHGFINFDDNNYVYNNPMVARGLTFPGIVWAFTNFHSDNWHPLTWLSHMLDCQLYGLNPGGHHLTNVLLHTATVIALFLVLRQMTGAFWRSAFVAAVFAIHPLRVESVAWVAERKDVLSGLFFMLTIGAYVRCARGPSRGRYGLVVFLFILGLMCKPMLVTLPLVLLLLDYWPLQRAESPRRIAIDKVPLLALSVAGCMVTLLAQNGAIESTGTFSLLHRLGNALVSCMVYLGEMVWPAGLAVFYPYPHDGLPQWEITLAGILLAVVSAFVFWQRRKQPWLLMGWLWYLVMLLPVVGLVQVGRQAHADRYTYLPQIGICIAVTWLVAQWQVSRVVLGSLMAGVLAALMVCAWKQTAYWQDSETLWRHTLACTTDNYMAHYNLGVAFSRGERLDEAISEFQKAVDINPDDAKAHNNLGDAFDRTGKVNEAIPQFQKAVEIKPDYAEAHYNLGLALGQTGRVNDAIAQYQDALHSDSNYTAAHIHLGIALVQAGRLDEAIAQYKKVLQLDPGNAQAHNNLGSVFLQKGNVTEAIAQFQQAAEIDPTDPWIKNNLAWLLATSGEASLRDGHKAVELATQADELVGGENPIILHALAAALAEAGQFSEAVEIAKRALRLAEAQSKTELAAQLQSELKLYQAGSPFHSPAQTH